MSEERIEEIDLKDEYKKILDIDDIIRKIFYDLDNTDEPEEKKKIIIYLKGKSNNDNIEKKIVYKGDTKYKFDENDFETIMSESLEQFIFKNIGFGEFDKINVRIKCFVLNNLDVSRWIEKPIIVDSKINDVNIDELKLIKKELSELKAEKTTDDPFERLKQTIELQQLMQPKSNAESSNETYKLLQNEQSKNDRLENRILTIIEKHELKVDRIEEKFKNEIRDLKEDHFKEIRELKDEFKIAYTEIQEELEDANDLIDKLKNESNGNTFTNTIDKLLDYGSKMINTPHNPQLPATQSPVSVQPNNAIPPEKLKMLVQQYSGTLSVIKMYLDKNYENQNIKSELLKINSEEITNIKQNKDFIIQVLPQCTNFLKEMLGFQDNQLIKLLELIKII